MGNMNNSFDTTAIKIVSRLSDGSPWALRRTGMDAFVLTVSAVGLHQVGLNLSASMCLVAGKAMAAFCTYNISQHAGLHKFFDDYCPGPFSARVLKTGVPIVVGMIATKLLFQGVDAILQPDISLQPTSLSEINQPLSRSDNSIPQAWRLENLKIG